MSDELKEVLVRLDHPEERLGTVVANRSTAALTVDEVHTYHKVATALWEDGCCGINETSPCVFKCQVLVRERLVPIPIPRKCDVECTCGPCNIATSVLGGGWRFGGLG